MRGLGLAAGAAALAVVFGAGSAGAAVVTVLGTAGPWSTADNPGFSYSDDGGQTDATSVAVIGGEHETITYLSGSTTTDGNTANTADANGYCCTLGKGFNGPGQYANQAPLLMELVGVFTDANGVIVGNPFVVGDGPTSRAAPAGASFLNLGVNDNEYHDNTGSLSISVVQAAVPEPGTWAVMLIGMAGMGAALRRGRRALALA